MNTQNTQTTQSTQSTQSNESATGAFKVTAPAARAGKPGYTAPYTAETWPIALAMLSFGGSDSQGNPIQDASVDEWADDLDEVVGLGYTEIDPTDTWVRVADLEPARLQEFKQLVADKGLTIPAISTSRRSIVDTERGNEYLAYSHRLLDAAKELGCDMVSFGFFQAFKPEQTKALWFWLADGHQDTPEMRDTAVQRTRELAEHAAANGQQITLEMYEDTYIGTCDEAVRFVNDVNHPSCGLNPDLGNFIRLHRPMEPVQQMFDKVLPYANYWHVKNYLRDEDPATGSVTTFPVPMEMGLINYRTHIRQALDMGFTGAFLTEHYGSDSLGVCAKNREYIRSVLASIL